MVLAASESAELSIGYLDAYPEGFELRIEADTTVGYRDMSREGDDHGPDVFGRHWPMGGEPRDSLPPKLLRVGVEFADGRRATNIGGHDRPLDGPIMWPLEGGGGGHGDQSSFRQGYWLSPLPPPGPVTIICEWPALGIPLVRHEIDAERILEAAERARVLFPSRDYIPADGLEWRLGTDADISWINAGTSAGKAITSAIPPLFDSYCTLLLPEKPETRDADLAIHERAMVEVLRSHTTEQHWLLGYLDTGATDVVFPYAPRTTMYYGYGYVLVEAGLMQAASWRTEGWNTVLADLMFPQDRSLLLTTMWDDSWTCIGGSEHWSTAS